MIMGTPSYMAPEQAHGQVHDVGPAADVYALGAILYECLTGRPPFKAATALETLQQVGSQIPVPPNRLQPTVPRDLNTICLKCLEKEPARRYADAPALGDDLDCFLTGRPIQARPASLPERAWKWARRRPAVAALLSGLAAAILALGVVLVWSYVRVSQEAERAKKESRFAQSVVEDMYSRVAEEWLADQPEKDPLQKEFLEKALAYYESLAHTGERDPEARRATARAYFRMGQLHRTLNHHEEALAAYQQAIALQQQLCDEFPDDPRCRQDQANNYNWLGELLRDSERSLAEAEQDFRKATALQEQLAREAPGEPAYRRELARSHSNLGLVEMDTERRAEAGQDYDRAVELLEGVVKEQPDNSEFRHELARTCTNRGIFRWENGRPSDAEADYSHAIDLLEELRRTGPARVVYKYNLAIAYQDRANLYFRRKKYDDALADLGRAETILTRLTEDFPLRARYRKKLAKTYNSVASVRDRTNRLELAEENWTRARDLLTDLTGHDPTEGEYQADLGICLGNLGTLKVRQTDLAGGRALLEQAIEHLRTALRSSPQRLSYREALRNQYQALAETLVRAENRADAVQAATNLAQTFPDQALGYYYAACFVARCVHLVEKESFADAEARRAATG
jgi:tetratricopeptide (TPR) repeat protein